MTRNTLLCIAGTAALALTTASFAHDPDDDENRGKEVMQEYELKGFDRIEVGGVYELNVKVGNKFSVTLEGVERDMARVDIRVENGALMLGHNKDRKRWNRHNHHDSIAAKITLPALNGIDVSGVVDGSVDGVKSDAFELTVSGVGDIDIAGVCKNLRARISGVGDVDAENLRCDDVDVQVSGVGDATVYASVSVDARVSGMGDIDVYGSPKKISQSGGMFSEVNIR